MLIEPAEINALIRLVEDPDDAIYVHVKEKLAGNIVDTTQFIDYSIVNPRDLPRDLQMDICQRCHLQGVAVLNEGKTFFDFKPGMALAEVMNVFLPRYTNSHERFIMASQADRLRLSECFKTGEMSCITCHNPHKSSSCLDTVTSLDWILLHAVYNRSRMLAAKT